MNTLKVFTTRAEMVREMIPKHGIGCEIGVYAGEFAQSLINITNPQKLFLIDAWDLVIHEIPCSDEHGNNMVTLPSPFLYKTTVNRFSTDSRVNIIKGWSSTEIPAIPSSLDWVYVDANHSYEGCLNDLKLIEPKMNKNSFIMGHDYEINTEKCRYMWNFGVGKAVDDFCKDHGWELIAKAMDGCVSYCLQRKG